MQAIVVPANYRRLHGQAPLEVFDGTPAELGKFIAKHPGAVTIIIDPDMEVPFQVGEHAGMRAVSPGELLTLVVEGGKQVIQSVIQGRIRAETAKTIASAKARDARVAREARA
jgi:hypothetical protein